MHEDKAVWKEGVRPLMEAQKGKNNILFERLFSRNKKINALALGTWVGQLISFKRCPRIYLSLKVIETALVFANISN